MPALNDLLSGFGIAFGDSILAGSFSMGAERTHFASGANLARFPSNGTVHRFSLQVQSEAETAPPNEVVPAVVQPLEPIIGNASVVEVLAVNGSAISQGGEIAGNLTGVVLQAGHSAVGAAKKVNDSMEAVGTADAGALGNDLNVSWAEGGDVSRNATSAGSISKEKDKEAGVDGPAFEDVPNERGGFDPAKNAELNEVQLEEERRKRARRTAKDAPTAKLRPAEGGALSREKQRGEVGRSSETAGVGEASSVQGGESRQRRRLAGAPNSMATAPILGLTTVGEGRIVAYGDSNCLDSSHQVRKTCCASLSPVGRACGKRRCFCQLTSACQP